MPKFAWPIVLLVVAIAVAYPAMMIDPPAWDAAGFKWMGRRILQGDVMYRDIWDHKLPVIHWINALAAVLGLGPKDQQTALFLMQSAGIAATGWLIGLLVRRHVGSGSAAVLTSLIYVTLGSMRATLTGGNFTEDWAALFAVVCIYAAVRAASGGGWIWPILSGFGLGATACLRPPSVLIGGALLLLLPSLRRARRLAVGSVLGWFAGFAIVPAAVCGWAASQGVLGLMGSLCVGFNVIYASQPVPAMFTWSGMAQQVLSILVETWVWQLLAAMGLASLVFDWVERRSRGPGRVYAPPRPPAGIPIGALVLAWLAAAVVSSCFTRIFYNHYYYLVLAPTAMLTAWAWRSLAGLCRRFGPSPSAWLFWVVPVAVFAWIGHLVWADYGDASAERRDAACVDQAVEFLTRHGRPADTLYVFAWGFETDISARLGWRCPSRHAYAGHYPPLPGALVPGGLMEQWRDEMLASPPDWLICTERDDLVAGHVRPECGWGLFPRAVELGGKVSERYEQLYVDKARFYSGGPKEKPIYCIIIYRRK